MTSTIDTDAAHVYFTLHDPYMAQLLAIALSGEKTLTIPVAKRPEFYFESIASSILSQQISTAAARAIKGRVVECLGVITPDTVAAVDFDILKACGLSEKKTRYLKHNAALWHTLPTDTFSDMSDEEIIAHLTKLYGIGRWTAEMFLLFSMARPDVFSYGDLVLRQRLLFEYQYRPHHVRKIASTIERWSPHRSIASLVLWHTNDSKK